MAKGIWLSICVDSPGYIEEYDDSYGFRVIRELYAPLLQRDLARKAVEFDGKLYVSNETLSAILDTRGMRGAYLKYGSRKMWKVTEELLLKAMESNAYPRRNEREEQVQRRNDSLIDWLSEYV